MKVLDLWGVIVNVDRQSRVVIRCDNGDEIDVRTIEKYPGLLMIKPSKPVEQLDLKYMYLQDENLRLSLEVEDLKNELIYNASHTELERTDRDLASTNYLSKLTGM